MKTENFDDAIKRKVESIDHRFEEKDVERVLKYVNTHKSPGFLRGPFRRLFVFSLAGLMLTGVITWKLTEIHDKAVLGRTIAALKKDLGRQNPAPVISGDQTALNTPKNLTGSNPADDRDMQKDITADFGTTDRQFVKPFHKEIRNKTADKKQSLNDNNKKNNTTETGVKTTDKPGNNTTGNNDSRDRDGGSNSGNSSELLSHKNMENGDRETNKSTGNQNATDQDIALNKKEIQTKKPDTSGNGSTYRSAKKGNNAKTPNNWRVMSGLDFTKGMGKQIGGGLTAELLLNNRFSFRTGIKMLSIGTESEYTEQEINDKCGEDYFRNNYLHGWHNNDRYENISTQAGVIQIPVGFSFYIPLKNHLALSATVSTDLDIYKYLNLEYEDIKKGPPPNYSDMVTTKQVPLNGPGVLMNNITGSVGILKQWGPVALQANAYFGPQLTYTDYKLDPYYWGLNLRLMYCFGKVGF
jgi:hypothetical protein